jgi:hypothetical protein
MSIAKYFELKDKLKNIEYKIQEHSTNNNLAGSLTIINDVREKMLQIGGEEDETATLESMKQFYGRLLLVYLNRSSAEVNDIKRTVSDKMDNLQKYIGTLKEKVKVGSELENRDFEGKVVSTIELDLTSELSGPSDKTGLNDKLDDLSELASDASLFELSFIGNVLHNFYMIDKGQYFSSLDLWKKLETDPRKLISVIKTAEKKGDDAGLVDLPENLRTSFWTVLNDGQELVEKEDYDPEKPVKSSVTLTGVSTGLPVSPRSPRKRTPTVPAPGTTTGSAPGTTTRPTVPAQGTTTIPTTGSAPGTTNRPTVPARGTTTIPTTGSAPGTTTRPRARPPEKTNPINIAPATSPEDFKDYRAKKSDDDDDLLSGLKPQPALMKGGGKYKTLHECLLNKNSGELKECLSSLKKHDNFNEISRIEVNSIKPIVLLRTLEKYGFKRHNNRIESTSEWLRNRNNKFNSNNDSKKMINYMQHMVDRVNTHNSLFNNIDISNKSFKNNNTIKSIDNSSYLEIDRVLREKVNSYGNQIPAYMIQYINNNPNVNISDIEYRSTIQSGGSVDVFNNLYTQFKINNDNLKTKINEYNRKTERLVRNANLIKNLMYENINEGKHTSEDIKSIVNKYINSKDKVTRLHLDILDNMKSLLI